MMTFLH